MTNQISDSEFYMWRTLFAMSHVDGTVSNEEIRFMVEAMEDIPFSAEQKNILNEDIKIKRDVDEMFEKISDIKDQARFFRFAHDLVYVDGNYGKEEQEILLRLKRLHLQRADVDQLVGKVSLELEPDEAPLSASKPKIKKKDAIFSFRRRFLEEL